MLRLIHYSDVHLTAKPLGWRPRDILSKRTTGWVNVRVLGRGRRFRFAPTVAVALVKDVRDRQPDGVVFSGDATGLGFESEFAAAAAALGVGDESLPPTVAVPGNHDYYTRRAVREGLFEKYFAPWQVGERLDEHPYPFARKVGPAWLVCTNSATANRWNWDASGALGPGQLARMKDLCDRIGPGPRLFVTHYPLRTAHGLVEPRVHRLRDHAEALDSAAACRVGAWLHGHIHKPFWRPADSAVPFPLLCAGSATQNNRWAYHEYTLVGHRLGCLRRVYDPASGGFVDDEKTSVELGHPGH